MKHSQKYQLYLWFINTLKEYGGLTLEELKRKWVEDKVDGGNPLIRSSFYRHRDAILDMFGIVIECEPKTYKHYIANPEVLNDDSIERWMFSTMTVHGVLADLATLRACAAQVREYFWSESAMTVIFCVCRDCFSYPDNMSQFEREFECRENLLANTFRNNHYMQLHIDKWKQSGAKSRVLTLVDVYRRTVDKHLDCYRKETSVK